MSSEQFFYELYTNPRIVKIKCTSRTTWLRTEINGDWTMFNQSPTDDLISKTVDFMKNYKLDIIDGKFVIERKNERR